MLETELFALLECTAEAAYTVTVSGEICSWNGAAERLFGYRAAAALRRNIDELFNARDTLGTDALAGGMEAATRRWNESSGGISNFDLEVTTESGDRLWVVVSTIVFDNSRTGRRLFIRLAHDITHRRRKEQLFTDMLALARDVVTLADDASEQASDHAPVELLSDQERKILTLFAAGDNPASIGRKLKISPQTLRNHLHHINRKLRTHNRLEAVTHARRRGLIE